MKKILLLSLLVTLSFTINFGQTVPTVGDGSVSNPYEIETLDNLKWIEADDSRWDKHYKQVANIDLGQTSIRIGDVNTGFTGSYDGNGYIIDNLKIDVTSARVGFFGVIEGATISNLGLTNVYVAGSDRTGALVGESKNGATITNCYTTGSVTSSSTKIGGLVGFCYIGSTTISNCYSECTVSSTSSIEVYAGGLVGYLNGTIEKSYATGDVTVSNSTTSSATSVGGLVGYNKGTISECYSIGNVEATGRVGGFVGTTYTSSAAISNCYSFGNVTLNSGTSTNKIGGFVGFTASGSSMENCYSIGSVYFAGATDPTDKGFVGEVSTTPTNCFFDKESSNQTTDASATGKTTTEMKTQSTFTDAGWDFTSIWEIIAPASSSGNSLAKANANGNYPNLQNNPNSALPVELTAFSATVTNDVILLNWSTATEVNNYGFEVERKQTDAEWNKIGFVEGNGNSNSPKYYTFTDNTVPAGKYLYRLKQIDIDGKFEYSNEIEVDLSAPVNYELSQNYPNPFNPTTVIKYSIPEDNFVTIKLYNILGKEVSTLVNDYKETGKYKVSIDGSKLSSGVYFYSIQAGNFREVKKMILQK